MGMSAALHLYAYYRYVLPVWVEYSIKGTDEARKASADKMAQLRGPIEFAVQNSLRITPRSLITIPELRKSFFDYLREETDVYANLVTMEMINGSLLEKHEDCENFHSIVRILNFYDILRQLSDFNGISERTMQRHGMVSRLHQKLSEQYLLPGGTEYIHIDPGTRSTLLTAIASPDEGEWDFRIFHNICKRIAKMLCNQMSESYTNAKFSKVIEIQQERSRQLKALSNLGLYDRSMPEDHTFIESTNETYSGILDSIMACFRPVRLSKEELEMNDLLDGVDRMEEEDSKQDAFPSKREDSDSEGQMLTFEDVGCYEDTQFTCVNLD